MFDLFSEFNQVVAALQPTRIRYAVVGGIAVAVHGGVRSTKDIDFLVHPKDIDAFKRVLRSCGFAQSAPPWTFKDSRMTLHRFIKAADGGLSFLVDVLVPLNERGVAILRSAKRLKWGQGHVRVARERDLIEMKSARLSHTDQEDIRVLRKKCRKKTVAR